MWKKLKQKGAETVEYAIVLACIAGLCVMFSDNLKATMDSLIGNVGSSFTDSDKKDDKDALYSKINDANLAWLKNKFFGYTQTKEFNDKMLGSQKKRYDANFKNDAGITDSEASSAFTKLIDSSDLKDCSWAFAGYTDKATGDVFYNVSIYDPRKNDNKKLSELNNKDLIKTDIYKVNAKTGEVTTIKNNAEQMVVNRKTENGYSVANDKYNFNVIRDTNFK